MSLEDYLSCWLIDVVHGSVRPSTYRAYEMFVRVHLVPALGRHRLERLSAADVRRLVNAKLASGLSVGSVRKMHAVLRAALEQAMRDDLLVRNVAKLVAGTHRTPAGGAGLLPRRGPGAAHRRQRGPPVRPVGGRHGHRAAQGRGPRSALV